MRTEKKKLLVGAAALVVLGFVLYQFRNYFRNSNFACAGFWTAVRSANPRYILLGIGLIYLCFALRALRWQIFQKNLGKAKLWEIYKMTLAGFAALVVLGRPGVTVR